MNVVLADDVEAAAGDTIRAICASTEPEIKALLPMLPDELTFTAMTGTTVIPETGEVGGALSPDHVRWIVRPDDIAGIAERFLRFSLFHELHHVARGWVMSDVSPVARFIDAAVSEGMATAFERDAAGSAPLWGEYPADVDAWVRELLAFETFPNYQHWMFEHPDGRRWIGYRTGTYITDRAMAASGRTAADLVQVPAEQVLALAGIDG